ncbi:MAG: hypothetical protein WAN43_08910 [Rhodomicrobium sp.]
MPPETSPFAFLATLVSFGPAIENDFLIGVQTLIKRLQGRPGGLKVLQSVAQRLFKARFAVERGARRVFCLFPFSAGCPPLLRRIELCLAPLFPCGLLLLGQIEFCFKIGEAGLAFRVIFRADFLSPLAFVFRVVSLFGKSERGEEQWHSQSKNEPMFYHERSPVFRNTLAFWTS